MSHSPCPGCSTLSGSGFMENRESSLHHEGNTSIDSANEAEEAMDVGTRELRRTKHLPASKC